VPILCQLAVGTIVAAGLLSTKAASLALKLQVPIMAAIGLSILSLFLGAGLENREPELCDSYSDSAGPI